MCWQFCWQEEHLAGIICFTQVIRMFYYHILFSFFHLKLLLFSKLQSGNVYLSNSPFSSWLYFNRFDLNGAVAWRWQTHHNSSCLVCCSFLLPIISLFGLKKIKCIRDDDFKACNVNFTVGNEQTEVASESYTPPKM